MFVFQRIKTPADGGQRALGMIRKRTSHKVMISGWVPFDKSYLVLFFWPIFLAVEIKCKSLFYLLLFF